MTDQNSSGECLSEIIENARKDRGLTEKLISDLIDEIRECKNGNTPDANKNERAGNTVNKYIQSLQRSNEQLIKAAKILRKKENEETDQNYDFNDFNFDEEEEVVLSEEEEG